MDTDINLEFVEDEINASGKLELSDGNFTFEIPDSVPFLGGGVAELSFPDLPVELEITDSKIALFINISEYDSNNAGTDEWVDDTLTQLKTLCDITQYAKAKNWNAFKNMVKDDKLVKLPGGEWSAAIGGYAEADWGASQASGGLLFLLRGEFSKGYQTMVWIIPVTVQFSVYGENKTIGELTYDWKSHKWGGTVTLTPHAELAPFAGIGVSRILSMGIYGGAELDGSGGWFSTKNATWSWSLTGSLGIKAYIAAFDFKKSFAHHTWILWPRQAQLQGTEGKWLDSIYNASEYRISDLDYLSKESAWMGDTASLLEAAARTELLPLLSDTYRNAQPVMTATDNALYAAFVRADVDSGARYVVVTKFDGISWSEPVRADTNAVLDSAPILCADGDAVYLAYARTTENPDDSLLSYALKQEIVVGNVDPNTLSFTNWTVESF